MHCIGMDSLADKVESVKRERCCNGPDIGGDAAISLLGSFVAIPNGDDAPFAFALGKSVKDSFSDTSGIILWRDSCSIDLRNNEYEERLVVRRMKIGEAIDEVCERRKGNESECEGPVESVIRNRTLFCLRWRQMSLPSSRQWSRLLSNPKDVLGYLEINYPYILLGGRNVVNEFRSVADDNILKEAIE